MANEKRLIDANALVKLMCRACNNECCEEPCEPGECFIYDAVSNAPTVDAVEVVRCKDCINQMGDGACCVIDEGGADDFFCAYGERRTE